MMNRQEYRGEFPLPSERARRTYHGTAVDGEYLTNKKAPNTQEGCNSPKKAHSFSLDKDINLKLSNFYQLIMSF